MPVSLWQSLEPGHCVDMKGLIVSATVTGTLMYSAGHV